MNNYKIIQSDGEELKFSASNVTDAMDQWFLYYSDLGYELLYDKVRKDDEIIEIISVIQEEV